MQPESMTAQPMQMYWMSPMTAPFAPSEAGFAPMGPYCVPGAGQWSWPVEGLDGQAPHQLPIQQMSPLFEAVESCGRSLHQGRPQATACQRPWAQTACEHEQDTNSESQSEAEATWSRDLADEMLMQLKTGVDTQELVQRFQHWAFSTKVSSRAAQLVLQDASANHAMLLASSLQGHVLRAAQSKHANHVVQKIVEVLPIARVAFIVEELYGFGYETARHRFGCRLLCRILEHLSPGDEASCRLVDDVLAKVHELCSHVFGSYVIRHVLEFGLPEHKHRVAVALLPYVGWCAKHRLGSHVVEAAVKSCAPEDRRALATKLLADQDIAALAMNQFGRHVVRALLAMPGPLKDETEDALVRVKEQLKHSRFGRGVLHKVHAGSA